MANSRRCQSNENIVQLVDNLKELGGSDSVKQQFTTLVGEETTQKLEALVDGQDIELGEIGKLVSSEMLDLIKNHDYNVSDYILLFKILSAVGLSLNPVVMSAFPLNLLLQLYNASLVSEVSSHITGSLALEIDKRAKRIFAQELQKSTIKAIAGTENASVGDVFKKAILNAIGSDKYDFGAVTRMFQENLEANKNVEELMIGKGVEDEALEEDAQALEEATVMDAAIDEKK